MGLYSFRLRHETKDNKKGIEILCGSNRNMKDSVILQFFRKLRRRRRKTDMDFAECTKL